MKSIWAGIACLAMIATAGLLAPSAHAGAPVTKTVAWQTSLKPGVTTPHDAGDVTWPQKLDDGTGCVLQVDTYRYYTEREKAVVDKLVDGGVLEEGADSSVVKSWVFKVNSCVAAFSIPFASIPNCDDRVMTIDFPADYPHVKYEVAGKDVTGTQILVQPGDTSPVITVVPDEGYTIETDDNMPDTYQWVNDTPTDKDCAPPASSTPPPTTTAPAPKPKPTPTKAVVAVVKPKPSQSPSKALTAQAPVKTTPVAAVHRLANTGASGVALGLAAVLGLMMVLAGFGLTLSSKRRH